MNWSKIKTIFIILFLLSDIFLLLLLASSEIRSSSVSPDVIDSAIRVLESSGIHIDPDIIPKKVSSVSSFEAENVISEQSAFAKAILGEDAVKIADGTFESDSGMLTVCENSFSYKTESGFTVATHDEKQVEQDTSIFLKHIGFDLSHAKVRTERTEDSFTVSYSNHANGLPIFNSSVEVVFLDDGTMTASGTWFNLTDTSGQANTLKSAPSILIDLIPGMNTSGGAVELTDVTLGYIIPEGEIYHKSATLVPTWRVVDADGAQYFRDARNPQ